MKVAGQLVVIDVLHELLRREHVVILKRLPAPLHRIDVQAHVGVHDGRLPEAPDRPERALAGLPQLRPFLSVLRRADIASAVLPTNLNDLRRLPFESGGRTVGNVRFFPGENGAILSTTPGANVYDLAFVPEFYRGGVRFDAIGAKLFSWTRVNAPDGAQRVHFRYFLRVTQSAPRELGSVEDIYVDGAFTENFDDEWVVLEGEPDVQHAARTPTRDGWYGVLRLLRADAKLFVAIPRDDEEAPKEFPGRHEGRMMRLGDAPQWDKLREFFDAERIVDLVDLERDAVLAALAEGSLSVRSAGGEDLELRGDDTLRLVVEFPEIGRAHV